MKALLYILDMPDDAAVVSFGGKIAHALGADVTLLTVRPEGEDPDVGAAMLEQASESLADPPETRLIRRGSPETKILDSLAHWPYQLAILGAESVTDLRGLNEAAIAHRVASRADVSLLVVRTPPERVRSVLISTAGSDVSQPTIDAGVVLAQALQARVIFLHVVSFVPRMYAGLDRLQETLPELLQSETPIARHLKGNLAKMRQAGLDVVLELRHGLPGDEIVRSAARHGVDMLVIGGTAALGLSRLFMDEVSLKVIDRSPCPVLVVRAGFETPP